jgi:CheY-like chemotaxis protein
MTTVVRKENSKEAIKMVEKTLRSRCCGKYKLIIMDINMPIMNGIKATTILRKRMRTGEFPNTPIIALSAQTLRDDEHSYFYDEVGFDDYLTKPITKAEFIYNIRKYFESNTTILNS